MGDGAVVWCPVCGVRLSREELYAHGEPSLPEVRGRWGSLRP